MGWYLTAFIFFVRLKLGVGGAERGMGAADIKERTVKHPAEMGDSEGSQ